MSNQKGQGKTAENKISPIENLLFYNPDPSFPGVGGVKSSGTSEDFVCLSEFGKDGPAVVEVFFFFFFLSIRLILLFHFFFFFFHLISFYSKNIFSLFFLPFPLPGCSKWSRQKTQTKAY